MTRSIRIRTAACVRIGSLFPIPLILFALFLAGPAGAQQWFQTNGPGHAGVNAFLAYGNDVLAGTGTSGVYRSTNGGVTWSPSNAGIESISVVALAANSLEVLSGIEVTDTNPGGVYRSLDGGRTWILANTGIEGQTIASLFASDPFLLAGTVGSGIFKSTNGGMSWFPANSGIGNQGIRAIVSSGGTLFAAGDNNLYMSTDSGLSWNFTNGAQYVSIFSLFVSGSFIYGGCFQSIVRSTDGGASFSDPIPIPIMPMGTRVTSFREWGGALYASIGGFPGTGVMRSADHGLTWSAANGGIEIVAASALIDRPDRLLVGTPQKGVLATTDAGQHWFPSSDFLAAGTNIRSLLFDTTGLIAATGGDGPYRTTDRGSTWATIGVDPAGRLKNEIVMTVARSGSALLAASVSSGIFRSTNGGTSWAQSNQGLPVGPVFSVYSLQPLSGGVVVAGTSDGVFRSTNDGASWAATNVTDYVPSLTSEPGFVYAIVETGIFTTTGVYRSTDAGASFALVWQSMGMNPIVLASGDGFIYMGDLLDGFLRSSDHGVSWSAGNLSGGVFSILPIGSTVYAGGMASFGSMHRSTDHGATWVQMNAGLPPDASIEALASGIGFLYAGDDKRGVFAIPLSPASVAGAQVATLRLEQNAPNPFTDRTGIIFDLPRAGPARLTIHDVTGRVVAVPFDGILGAGTHRVDLTRPDLPAGTYFYRLETPGGALERKMIRAR